MSIIQTNCTQIIDGHPNLSTAEERFAWLMAVQKITSIFSEKANYDFNPLELLEAQANIVEVLRKTPSYSELLSKKVYHEIHITPPEGGFVYSDVQIKPEAIEAWKTELKGLQTSLGCQTIQGAIKRLLKVLPDEQGNSDVLNESVRALTFANVKKKSKKNTPPLSKAHNEAVISRIRKQNPSNFPQEIINVWEEFQDVDPNLRKNFEALANEQMLSNLLELWLVFDKQPNLDQLTAEDLIYFSDTQDVIKPKLDSFKKLKNQEAFSLKIAKHLKSYASQTTCTAKVAKSPIILTQEPPAVAIFRGCAGNDCSSLYSFPYPNDPNERVFFIYGEERALKGYVSAVEVMIDNEPALYVITANGAHLSAGDMEMIFQGLEAEKAQLGVNHIVLPTSGNIEALINFPAPKEIYRKYTNAQPLVCIEYKHPEIRQAIESFSSSYNSGTYDHRKRNAQGVIFTPKKQAELTVKVCPMIPTIQPQDLSQASPSGIAELLIPIHLTEKDCTMLQMLDIEKVAQKVSYIAFTTFLKELDNRDQTLSTSQWKSNLQDSLEKLNIEKEFLEHSHPEFLYPGILYRSDSFSPENINRTAKAMVADMKANNFEPTGFLFSDLLDETLKKLNETAAFKQYAALLATQLTEEDPGSCCKRLENLGELKPVDPEIHQIIAAYLQSQEWKVREAAAQALCDIKPAAAEIHRALVSLLRYPDEQASLKAKKALIAIKPTDIETLQALAALLKDQEYAVAMLAREILFEIKPAHTAFHQALALLLKDPNRRASMIAAQVLGAIQPSDVKIHQELAALLQDPSQFLRSAAAEALGKIQPEDLEIHQMLAALLQDPIAEVRTAAAKALGEIKPEDVKIHQMLAELLQDPDPEVRVAAAKALGQIRPVDDKIHQALAALLKNAQRQARGTLSQRQIRGALLMDKQREVRRAAAEALGAIKPADVAIHRVLAALLQDLDTDVCITALKALGEIQSEDEEIDRALEGVLNDREWEIRKMAAELLRDRFQRRSYEIKPGDVFNRSRAHHASEAFTSRGA